MGEEAFVTGHQRMLMWLYQDPQRPSLSSSDGRTDGRAGVFSAARNTSVSEFSVVAPTGKGRRPGLLDGISAEDAPWFRICEWSLTHSAVLNGHRAV